MDRIDIEIPIYNDSFSRVILSGKQYLIRFTYNHTCDFWTFGLYTSLKEPIVLGVKIVPNIPLDLFCSNNQLPLGFFIAYTEQSKIGRDDFQKGNATFAYISAD